MKVFENNLMIDKNFVVTKSVIYNVYQKDEELVLVGGIDPSERGTSIKMDLARPFYDYYGGQSPIPDGVSCDYNDDWDFI